MREKAGKKDKKEEGLRKEWRVSDVEDNGREV